MGCQASTDAFCGSSCLDYKDTKQSASPGSKSAREKLIAGVL